MRKKKYNYGDYIYLIWEDGGSPDAYYIRGHVSHDEGIATLIGEGAIDNEFEVGRADHIYGRWSMQPREDGTGHILRTYKEPGRGRFAITEFGVGIFAKKSIKESEE